MGIDPLTPGIREPNCASSQCLDEPSTPRWILGQPNVGRPEEVVDGPHDDPGTGPVGIEIRGSCEPGNGARHIIHVVDRAYSLCIFFRYYCCMATSAFRAIATTAEAHWGMVTTAQAESVGVSRLQMSRMAASGSLIRVAQGVYRVAGAPEHPQEPVLATWLALGGATRPATSEVPAVVAAGATAAELHHMGRLWPDPLDFVVPTRRSTRHPGVRLRTLQLRADEVTVAEGVASLTVERTIADLVDLLADLSLVADVVRDAVGQGRVVSPEQLVTYLDPLAAGHMVADGHELAQELFDLAGVAPLSWPVPA